ncbi:MAG: ABC transporter permease, partial [Microbacterium sp.]|nr:ABC transporter permease [Microbacterium sp.]
PVASELAQKAEVTVPLGIMSLTVALVVSVPLGVLSAMRRGRAVGTAMNVGAQTLAAVPVVWAGMMLVVVFAVWLGWLPAQGFPRDGWDAPGAAFQSLILPAVTIGVVEGAMLLRFVRSATLQAVGQDYVRTAAAKGLTRNQALIRHGLPNVGLSVITVLGLQVAGIIVGAVVIEQLFSLPGIGRMLFTDVGNRDLPKVQGELLVLTGFVLVVGFLVDLAHRLIDPRQREAS